VIRLDYCVCRGDGVRVLQDGLSLYLCRDCGKPTVERSPRAGTAAAHALRHSHDNR
jgi:hypothetical protein